MEAGGCMRGCMGVVALVLALVGLGAFLLTGRAGAAHRDAPASSPAATSEAPPASTLAR